jgi:hypothetical protein
MRWPTCCPIRVDSVEKLRNRGAPKISQMSHVGDFSRCKALHVAGRRARKDRALPDATRVLPGVAHFLAAYQGRGDANKALKQLLTDVVVPSDSSHTETRKIACPKTIRFAVTVVIALGGELS